MSKKQQADRMGFVFSTDPNFMFEKEEYIQETLPPVEQLLIVQLDTKQRGGKTVTLVSGYHGADQDLALLAKLLRNYCGTGGSAKDGLVIVQGDQREKVYQWLQKNGYSKTKRK
jgi:translation initiation factor 1